jgi:hypothetical protein
VDVDDCDLLVPAEACSIGSVASSGKLVPVPAPDVGAERQACLETHVALPAAKEAAADRPELDSGLGAEQVLALAAQEQLQVVVQDVGCMYQNAALWTPADAVLVST